MLTTAELNNKLNELAIEYRKVVDSENATEILRWVLSTAEFIREMYEEAISVKGMTENEREAFTLANCASDLNRKTIKALLIDRLARETENIEKALYTLTYALRSTRAGKDIDYIEVTEEGCGRTAVIHFAPGSGKRDKAVGIECDSALGAIIDVCKALSN